MNANKIKIAIISAIAVHIYGVHAKLLYAINPDKGEAFKDTIYSFIQLNEPTITTQIFALVYAIATAGILILYSEHIWKYAATITFAILDGAGMLIYYNTEIDKLFTIFSSSYYALYTIAIIVFVGLHSRLKDVYKDMDDVITTFKESGMSDKEISKQLNIPRRLIKNY